LLSFIKSYKIGFYKENRKIFFWAGWGRAKRRLSVKSVASMYYTYKFTFA